MRRVLRGLRRRSDASCRDSMVAERWVVVGLGNPDAEYGRTRHNIGADTVGALAERLGTSFNLHKAGAHVADGWHPPGGTPVSLVRPFGYYNDAGGSVQQVLAFYKVALERLIVVHDDIDVPFATLRLKFGGGSGGNKGVADIARRAGGPDFYRVRIGIGRPPGRQDATDYVLKRFPSRDREVIDAACARAADAVLDLVAHGLDHAQNRHHGGARANG